MTKIAFGTAGTGETGIVLLHGAGGQRADWPKAWRTGKGISDHGMTIVPDLPGHGQSPKPAYDNVTSYADALVPFLEELQHDRLILVGHSLGGAITLELAQRNIPKLSGVVIIAAAASFFVHPKMLAGFKSAFHKTVDTIVEFSWPNGGRESYQRQQRWHMVLAGSDIVHGDFKACADVDLSDSLPNISVPTLVIASTADRMVPHKNSLAMQAAIPSAKIVTHQDCGHFVHVERQGPVTDEITKFIAAV
ncbi:MAG: alpha/beta hydrolase [Pseudomonadota bacterium]